MHLEPRQFQTDLAEDPARFICAVIHRRAGKTVYAVEWLLEPAQDPDFPLVPGYRGYYVCPYAGQAKEIALEYFRLFADPAPKINVSALTLTWPHGAQVQLVGTEYNVHKHRGKLADRVLFDETAHIAPTAWTDIFRPMLSDRREAFAEAGYTSQAMFIGTPAGRLNQFHRFYELGLDPAMPDWSTHFVPASESGIIPERELALLKAEIGERAYAREMECSFDAGAEGAFFEDEMGLAGEENRIRPYQPDGAEVHTSWHFAPNAICIAWVQIDERGRPVFFRAKRFENARLEDVAELVKRQPYTYGRHYAGGAHLKPQDARFQIARDAGVRLLLVDKQSQGDAVQLVKSKLGRAVFSEDMAQDLVEAMRTVHPKFDDELGTFTEKAVEDLAYEISMPVIHFFGGHKDRRSDWSQPISYPTREARNAA